MAKKHARKSRPTRRARARRPGLPPRIYAQASPRSIGGVSMFEAGSRITEERSPLTSPRKTAGHERGGDRLPRPGSRSCRSPRSRSTSPGRRALRTHVQAPTCRRGAARRQGAREEGHGHLPRFAGHADAGPDQRAGRRSRTCSRAWRSRSRATFAASMFAPPKRYWHLRVPGDVSLAMQRRPRAPRRHHRAAASRWRWSTPAGSAIRSSSSAAIAPRRSCSGRRRPTR